MPALTPPALAGVTLPDSAQVGGKNLVLNGLGLRTKIIVKVYVAGLYLEQKSSDPNSVVKSDTPKRIVMKFVHGASKSQMADAFNECVRDNAPRCRKDNEARHRPLDWRARGLKCRRRDGASPMSRATGTYLLD